MFRQTKGIEITNLPFHLEWVGDLLSYDWPIISVYKDKYNQPFIKSWVESKDSFNRHLVYSIKAEALSHYIFGKTSYAQLLANAINHIIFVIDDKNKFGDIACKVSVVSDLPYDYLPNSETMFEDEDSEELEDIIFEFSLDTYRQKSVVKAEEQTFNILEESSKSGIELYNIHIRSSNAKVSYGVIRSSILGSLLTSFSDISEATAVNMFDSRKHGKKKRTKGEISKVKLLGETDFAYVKAASFSVFLKPSKKDFGLFSDSSSNKIAEQIFYVFDKSSNLESLKENTIELSDDLLKAYTSFLKTVKENDIDITVQYGDYKDAIALQDKFDLKKATLILDNLDKLEILEKQTNIHKGVFKALDSISNSFKFESSDENIFLGKFSDSLKSAIADYNLKDMFQITLETSFEKKRGKISASEKHTIANCTAIN